MADERIEEEYKFCHALLIENISILERTETYATGAIAACFVFSLASIHTMVAVGSAWVAVLIAIVGLVRWIGLDGVIGTLNDYLEVLGKELPHGGWTAFYRQHRSKYLKRSRWVIWILLISVSLIFAAFIAWNGPFAPAR